MQQQQKQPRKLLVHLTSESAAKTLLAEAKKLPHSDDPVVAESVNINPGRSPTEAKVVFQQQQQKNASVYLCISLNYYLFGQYSAFSAGNVSFNKVQVQVKV